MTTQLSERHPVDRLAEEFVARYRRGERPSISEYTEKYPELADKLQEILAALVLMEEHAPARAPLDESSSPDPRAAAPTPQQLGEYSIIRELGRGGMGVVYEAVQQSLGRHVALKVLPSYSLIDPLRLKRFQHEAQAAARLHHTNIVPVFGVGMEAGVHFYAMQFIQGRSLDDVLDELRRLKQSPESSPGADATHPVAQGSHGQTPVAANLSTLSDSPRYYHSVARLGGEVAEALEYAHHQGVLHRDIKPANLLLDAEGTIWITDFGLARCDGQEDLTHTGDLVGTLRYAAPERLRGEGDARADVYSLGVTLYELLTLRPAFEAADRVKLVRQIAQDEPPRPRRLDSRIPRDLETIVLKAIAKEPGRRYATAGDMTADLRRFLSDRPIAARRSPSWERGWRWCRRNPGVAAASGAAFGVLLVGFVVSLWQWQRADANYQRAEVNFERAEANFRRAETSATEARSNASLAETHAAQADQDYQRALQAIDQMLTRVGAEQLVAVPHMEQTRRVLLEDALRFYEQMLENPRSGQPARAAVAQAHWRMGSINSALGDTSQSARHFDEAIAIAEDLVRGDGKNPIYRSLLGNCHHSRSFPRKDQNQFAEAEADCRAAARIWKDLCAEFPQRPEFVRAHISSLQALGNLLQTTSRPVEGEPLLQQSIELAEGLLASDSSSDAASVLLANGLQNLAALYQGANRRLSDAEQLSRRALEVRERIAGSTRDLNSRIKLAQSLASLASIQYQRGAKPDDDTEQLFLRALILDRELVADFPDIPQHRHQLASATHDYGLWLVVRGRTQEAEVAYADAIAAWEAAAAKQPETVEYRTKIAGAWNNLAILSEGRGDLAGALELLEKAIRQQEAVLNINQRKTTALAYLEKHYTLERRIRTKLGDADETEQAIGRQLAFLKQLADRDPQFRPLQVLLARMYAIVGQLQRNAGRLAEADEAYRTSATIWRAMIADGSTFPAHASELGATLHSLAETMRGERRWMEMIPLLEEAIQHQTAAILGLPQQPNLKQLLHGHYLMLAESQRALANHRPVIEIARSARESCPDAYQHYSWAVNLAACIPLAETDSGLAPDERDRLIQQYADQALMLLQAAQEKKSKELAQLAKQPEFKPLYGRADFQALLASLKPTTK